ncbi:MAG TPA: cysteine desulfurase NifS [Acidobacteriota bacterium]|nr:cysteine desulfurase NifS [Acidobacteriota bacterium]
MRQVYFDNNATTPVDPLVLEAMRPYFLDDFGNASSIHGFGQRARAALEEARRQIADLIGAQAQEIVITSGGTESDNTALRGTAYYLRDQGNHIITTTIEHPAVLRTCEQLEKEGFEVTYVPAGKDGQVRIDLLEAAIKDQTILMSVMYVNNETGTIQPIKQIAELARRRKVVFHTDAVQAVGKIPVDVKELGVDLLSLSGHKLHGPKGIGALYVRRGIRFNPLLLGGPHERNRRAGTENVPGVVGLGKASELAKAALEDFGTRVRGLRDRLEKEVLAQIPDTSVNGSRTERVPHVTNLSFRGTEGEALLISLDFQGVAVSTGSACSSGSIEPSHVLRAMGIPSDLIHGSLRFSLSRMNTDEDVDYLLSILPQTVGRMREMSPLYRDR